MDANKPSPGWDAKLGLRVGGVEKLDGGGDHDPPEVRAKREAAKAKAAHPAAAPEAAGASRPGDK